MSTSMRRGFMPMRLHAYAVGGPLGAESVRIDAVGLSEWRAYTSADTVQRGMHPASVIFEEELRRRAIQFAYTLDGRYQIEFGGGTIVLNLENVSRDFDRNGDPGRILRYIESSLAVFAPLPLWEEAKSRIYWSAEPSNAELGETVHESVTDRVSRVLVFADFDQGRIRWLTPKCQERWPVSMSELDVAARRNLDRLLRGKRLSVARDSGRTLGMVPLDSGAEALKASVIFAPGLKAFVETDLGWPVLAVIPCRDFIYLFGEGDDVLDVVGSVVQEEFRNSGYPITTEVLRISDEGIEGSDTSPSETSGVADSSGEGERHHRSSKSVYVGTPTAVHTVYRRFFSWASAPAWSTLEGCEA